jgi:hypothetical protein
MGLTEPSTAVMLQLAIPILTLLYVTALQTQMVVKMYCSEGWKARTICASQQMLPRKVFAMALILLSETGLYWWSYFSFSNEFIDLHARVGLQASRLVTA